MAPALRKAGMRLGAGRMLALSALLVLMPSAAGAASLDGASIGAIWAVPFIGLLLSIAVLPLVTPHLWHYHYGKISAAWALAFVLPSMALLGPSVTLHDLVHTMLLEYIPFIILLLSLFTVSGGVLLKGNLHGSPALNTGILGIGTMIASITGTTGAAMLLIRPLLRANDNRLHNVHVFVFFIFLVANIGGSLTPLGDPPLFLGFLKGVGFFWPTVHLLAPMLLVASLLLLVFFFVDWYLFWIDEHYPPKPDPTPDSRLRIEGWVNVALLAGILLAVLMSGVWKPGVHFNVFGTEVELQNLARDLILIGITFASLKLTPPALRAANGFTWGPILEVAKLFAGIFVTIIPAIAILRAGTAGALGPLVSMVSNSDGSPNNLMYFWLTGGLSSFLDNAPTYLVFFNLAGGDPVQLTGPLAATLTAISAGAVFMGANTYIGNAPNLMVKAIAEDRGVKMPSFFGYMVWSSVLLLPCFALVTLIFLR